jgi:hypothetical protein
MNDEIKYDDSAKRSVRRAERWANVTNILGVIGILTFAIFVNQIAHRLGIPAWLGYTLAVLGGVAIVLLNWGIENVSAAAYGWFVAGFLAVMAIQTVTMCVFAFIGDGFSGQALGFVGVAAIFILTALVAWRLKVLQSRI